LEEADSLVAEGDLEASFFQAHSRSMAEPTLDAFPLLGSTFHSPSTIPNLTFLSLFTNVNQVPLSGLDLAARQVSHR
jgi:hypothetical protein